MKQLPGCEIKQFSYLDKRYLFGPFAFGCLEGL